MLNFESLLQLTFMLYLSRLSSKYYSTRTCVRDDHPDTLHIMNPNNASPKTHRVTAASSANEPTIRFYPTHIRKQAFFCFLLSVLFHLVFQFALLLGYRLTFGC